MCEGEVSIKITQEITNENPCEKIKNEIKRQIKSHFQTTNIKECDNTFYVSVDVNRAKQHIDPIHDDKWMRNQKYIKNTSDNRILCGCKYNQNQIVEAADQQQKTNFDHLYKVITSLLLFFL